MEKRTLGLIAGGVVVLAVAGGGTYAGQYGTDPAAFPYQNAAPSGAIAGLEDYSTAIETLAPGEGICVLMTINTFDHPSRPWHMNALQGDQLDFDVRYDLVQS